MSEYKHPHIMPEDCKALMSEEGYAVLEANNLAIDIQQSVTFMRTYQFPFAAVYDQIPLLQERDNYSGKGAYTCIKDAEFGATDDETAQNTLTRLGLDLAEVQYWLVYLTELAEPNEDGVTKIFTLDTNNLPAERTHFAGFGWQYKSVVEAENLKGINQEKELIRELGGIMYWLNDMILGVTLRDADDGMYLIYYEALRRKGALDSRVRKHGKSHAESVRSRSDYAQKKREFNSKTHVIPDKYQHLVSDESRAELAREGLLIKIKDLPINSHLNTGGSKTFGVQGYYPSEQWVVDHHNSSDYTIIDEQYLEASVEDTAKKLMATMGGDLNTMSYCPVYQYEGDEPNEYGHTKLYTTNLDDFVTDAGTLAAIVVSYDLGITPLSENERAVATAARHANHLLPDTEKQAALESWQKKFHEQVKHSLFEIETWANGTLIDVAFHSADTGDYLYGYRSKPYKNTDADAFNAQLQVAIKQRIEDIENHDANNRAFLTAEVEA